MPESAKGGKVGGKTYPGFSTLVETFTHGAHCCLGCRQQVHVLSANGHVKTTCGCTLPKAKSRHATIHPHDFNHVPARPVHQHQI